MQQLTFVGIHDDGEHLVLEAGPDGERYRVRIDQPLRQAVVRARRALQPRSLSGDGVFGPRDIQTRFRQGATVEEIVAESGWKPERVRRYESPILAERAHVVRAAQAAPVSTPQAPRERPLHHQVVAVREDYGFAEGEAVWNSWQREDGQWNVTVSLEFSERALRRLPEDVERPARFVFNPANQSVSAANAAARFLLGQENPQEVTAPVAPAEEHDDAAAASPAPAAGEQGSGEQSADGQDAESLKAEALGAESVESEFPAAGAQDAPEVLGSPEVLGTPEESAAPADDITAEPADSEADAPAETAPSEDSPAAEPAANEPATDPVAAAERPRAARGHLRPVEAAPQGAEDDLLDELERRRGQQPAPGDEQTLQRLTESYRREAEATQQQTAEKQTSQKPAAETESAEQNSRPAGEEGSGSSREETGGQRGRSKRPSVPSWDDIVFGSRH